MMKNIFDSAVVLLAASVVIVNAEMIPFVLPWDDTNRTVVSVAEMNPPIGNERVKVSPSGHLVLTKESEGQETDPRIRFIGMNMTFESGLPPREMAPKVAGRLAKFGINGVRFHHVDNNWCNALIDYKQGDSRHINKQRLDDLHYFISQLKTNGVYVDMNLLVSRQFKSSDSLPPEVDKVEWKVQHILGFFNDTALELQKEYATGILTPVNPYTGLPMAKDPVVAFAEIINENGIIQAWMSGYLDHLPDVFKRQLQARWNEWLVERYDSVEELRTAWNSKKEPFGENTLKPFGKGADLNSHWRIEVHSGKAKATVLDNDGPAEGISALRIDIEEPSDTSWHVQLNQPGNKQTQGQVRTLSFWAKADHALDMTIRVMQSQDPWGDAGLNRSVSLSNEWKHFSFSYLVPADEKDIRPNFNGFADQKCSVWFADIQLMDGGSLGNIPDDASLKKGNIPIVDWQGDAPATWEARKDWLDFLVGLENRYYRLMCQHLRETCGYEGLIFGTILANSPANVQAKMDIIDSHGYWQHPQFQGASWNSEHWTVDNVAMTDTFNNTFTSCALQRVTGKPFFCTEYQHPSPNSYSSEGPLLIAAYASLQDWDGFWLFDYGTGNGLVDMGAFRDFFSTGPHTTKMANLILASHLFRREDVKTAREQIVMGLTPETELGKLLETGPWSIATARHLGLPPEYALKHRVAMSVGEAPKGVTHKTAPGSIKTSEMDSDTEELKWQIGKESKQSFVQVDTAKTKALIGFTDNREFTLGDIVIRPGNTELSWSTIGITLVEGDSFKAPSKALIIATGRTENTDMQWKNEKHDSVGTHWGHSPVLTEPVPFEITLPESHTKVKCYALDPLGNRIKEIPLVSKGDKCILTSDNHSGVSTIWYEVIME